MAEKLAFDPKKMAAMGEVRKALRDVAREDLATTLFSVGAVAALLDIDPKTLHSARVSREEMLGKGKVIPPLWLESLPYAGTRTSAKYTALDLVEYLDRQALAPTLKVSAQNLPESYPKLNVPRTFLGFQSWLSHAEVTDLWPFAIQPDGRPMDVIAAILCEQVGDDVRWLTIREFGNLAADTALRAFHAEEKAVLLSEPTMPVEEEPGNGKDTRNRWERPGGPM